jgi:Flp pilus assembly protein TadD
LRAELGRDVRNERLLRRALDEDPSDGELAGHLAAQLLKAERRSEARAVGERSLQLFLRAIDTRPAGHPAISTVRLGYALSVAQADTGAPAAALATARECAARFPVPHANLVFAEAYALEKLRRFSEAADAYRRCLALDGAPSSQQVLTGVTSHLARQRLGIVYAAQGLRAP